MHSTRRLRSSFIKRRESDPFIAPVLCYKVIRWKRIISAHVFRTGENNWGKPKDFVRNVWSPKALIGRMPFIESFRRTLPAINRRMQISEKCFRSSDCAVCFITGLTHFFKTCLPSASLNLWRPARVASSDYENSRIVADESRTGRVSCCCNTIFRQKKSERPWGYWLDSSS